MPITPITKKDYELAILAQDACNLSGVARSLAEVAGRLWYEPECTGTNWVNTHPLVIMYVSKLASLSGAERGLVFSEAYGTCVERSE